MDISGVELAAEQPRLADKRRRETTEEQPPLAVYNDDLPWMRGSRNKGRGKGSKSDRGGKSSGSGQGKGQKDQSQITSVKKEQYRKK